MLVLTRRVGSSLMIGHHIKVTVVSVADGDVCLAVHGPANLPVVRAEVVAAAERLQASGGRWDPTTHHALSTGSRPSLLVGEGVRLSVLGLSGDSVRLGIDAPVEVEVHREEVYLEIVAANRSAAGEDPPADLSRYLG